MNKHDIRIIVKSQYLSDQSNPDEGQFVHAYTIRIENHGETTVQLISRKWHIVDANDDVQEVSGIGVVGEQPHIVPGEHYVYTSGAVIATPTGTMEGAYTMENSDGDAFDVAIPLFSLVQPSALH